MIFRKLVVLCRAILHRLISKDLTNNSPIYNVNIGILLEKRYINHY